MVSRDELIKRRYVTFSEGARLYGIGVLNFRNKAKDAGAVFRMGKRYIVDMKIVSKYMAELEEV